MRLRALITTRPQPCSGFWLVPAVLAVACHDPGKPLVPPSQVVGVWVLELDAPPACTNSGAGQQLHLDLALTGQAQSPSATVTGGWDFDGRVPPRYQINGAMDLRTAHLDASLWQQVDVVGSKLDVVVESYNAMQGQLTDPAPGASGNFSGGSCTFQATGHR
jgi:hypothetical protein